MKAALISINYARLHNGIGPFAPAIRRGQHAAVMTAALRSGRPGHDRNTRKGYRGGWMSKVYADAGTALA
ncbi:MAG: hypothetical protein V4579_11935, partial [Pseudomonadota bacterium]